MHLLGFNEGERKIIWSLLLYQGAKSGIKQAYGLREVYLLFNALEESRAQMNL